MLKTASAVTVSMKEGQGFKKVIDFTHFASTSLPGNESNQSDVPLTDDEATAKRSFTLKSA